MAIGACGACHGVVSDTALKCPHCGADRPYWLNDDARRQGADARTSATLLTDEQVFWQSLAGSRRTEDFEAFLKQFPDGAFASAARNRIAELTARSRALNEAIRSATNERTGFSDLRSFFVIIGVVVAAVIGGALVASITRQAPPPPPGGSSVEAPSAAPIDRSPPRENHPVPEDLSGDMPSPDSLTANATIMPMLVDGRLTGCQAVFDVVRRDGQYHRNEIVQLSGSVNLTDTSEVSVLTIKLGVAPADRPAVNEGFVAPDAAYLINEVRSNLPELARTGASDTQGFSLFLYALGPETTEALRRSLQTGRIQLAYQMNGGRVGAPFEVDLNATASDGGQKWGDCLQGLLTAGDDVGRKT